MFKRNSTEIGESQLDAPLLDRSEDNHTEDDLTSGRGEIGPPIASNVGILGVGPTRTKGYARVVDADESERAEQEAKARAERMNQLAMDRQRANQANFEEEMVNLEEKVVREAKEKARLEENDRLLALRLQQQEGGEEANFQMPETTTMMVVVPPNATGGQMIAVQVPNRGQINIMVPHGLKPGDQFNFKIPVPQRPTAAVTGPGSTGVQYATVKVPRGVPPGGTFRVVLPNNRILVVGIPAGVREGDSVRVAYDNNTGVPNTEAPREAQYDQNEYVGTDPQQDEALAVMESIEEVAETAAERAEREAFLAALPEDVRREVLAQETAQKRRLSAFKNPPAAAPVAPPPPPPMTPYRAPVSETPLTADQIEFLQSLPEELRAEVERDLRAQNAAQPPRQDQIRSPSRQPAPPPASNRTSAAAPAAGDADLLGLSSLSSAPLPTIAASSPVQPPVDMFQNLSVRGVSKDKSSKSQQI